MEIPEGTSATRLRELILSQPARPTTSRALSGYLCVQGGDIAKDRAFFVCVQGALVERGDPLNWIVCIHGSSGLDQARQLVDQGFLARCLDESSASSSHRDSFVRVVSIKSEEDDRQEWPGLCLLTTESSPLVKSDSLTLVKALRWAEFISSYAHLIDTNANSTSIVACLDDRIYLELAQLLDKVKRDQLVLLLEHRETMKLALFYEAGGDAFVLKSLTDGKDVIRALMS